MFNFITSIFSKTLNIGEYKKLCNLIDTIVMEENYSKEKILESELYKLVRTVERKQEAKEIFTDEKVTDFLRSKFEGFHYNTIKKYISSFSITEFNAVTCITINEFNSIDKKLLNKFCNINII